MRNEFSGRLQVADGADPLPRDPHQPMRTDELQYIAEERPGMAGSKTRDKREFLAFSLGGLEPVKDETGHALGRE